MRKPIFDAIRTALGRGIQPGEVADIDLLLDRLDVARDTVIVIPQDDLTRACISHLSHEEGREPSAYQDHLGYWTIGVGRLIDKRKGGKLREDEIDLMLANDIADRIDALADWPAWKACKGNVARQTALVSMAFQMGTAGLAGFKNSLTFIEAGAWATAAANLRVSKWAKQTPARAERVISMIETGVMA